VEQLRFPQRDWHSQPHDVALALKLHWPIVGQVHDPTDHQRQIRQLDLCVRLLGFVVDEKQETFVFVGADRGLTSTRSRAWPNAVPESLSVANTDSSVASAVR